MEASFICVQVTCFVCLFFPQGRKSALPESVVDFTYKHASLLKNARELIRAWPSSRSGTSQVP